MCNITGGHSKYDLRHTQKTRYLSIFTNRIWCYLLLSPVILLFSEYSSLFRQQRSPNQCILASNCVTIILRKIHIFYEKTRFGSRRRLLPPLRLRSTETSRVHTNARRELQPRSMSRAPGLHSRDLLYIPKGRHFNFLSPGRTVETQISTDTGTIYEGSLSSMQKRQTHEQLKDQGDLKLYI